MRITYERTCILFAGASTGVVVAGVPGPSGVSSTQ